MNYKNGISTLGFGCMRLPKNLKETEKLIMHGLDQGINYFDTAYIYPGNEEMLGKVISANGCRDRMLLASKMPHYLIRNAHDIDRIFETTLSRLKTDYIDYYLMHMLPDVKTWERLKGLGITEWLQSKKACGQIRHVGFSYHGNSRNFIELLDQYPWEFAQVQYNYMDENSQAGRAGVERAAEKGIPIFIMEPLRGGLLVDKLPPQAKKLIASEEPRRSAAEWALKWLWNQPTINMVLSGMTSIEMIDENVRIASESRENSLTEKDADFYRRLRDVINSSLKVGCTGCSYCMPCPYGVNIPGCFRCYNSSYSDGFWRGIKEYFMVTAFSRKPAYASLCRNCGRCLEHCPQSIPIPDVMKQVKKRLEIPGFGAARWFIKRILLRDKD
ncbi:MAG: aldo/keto reductase [Anaerovoracaceae bacterium]|jgi:predicted aldo/keto reductase-like oxidoreductase